MCGSEDMNRRKLLALSAWMALAPLPFEAFAQAQ
jgi:hypothetical protein